VSRPSAVMAVQAAPNAAGAIGWSIQEFFRSNSAAILARRRARRALQAVPRPFHDVPDWDVQIPNSRIAIIFSRIRTQERPTGWDLSAHEVQSQQRHARSHGHQRRLRGAHPPEGRRPGSKPGAFAPVDRLLPRPVRTTAGIPVQYRLFLFASAQVCNLLKMDKDFQASLC
jgi:hypothetical protein